MHGHGLLHPAGTMPDNSVQDDGVSRSSARARWVLFACAGQRFGLPLAQVREIVAPRQFTRLPGAGAEVCGLIGVRGRAVTVIDLGTVLGRRSSAARTDHRLLLLDLDERQVGVAVDEVMAILPAHVQAAEGAIAEMKAVLGTGSVDGETFLALDAVKLTEDLLQHI
jgi:chemotaxis signal transduction protein